MKYGDFYTHFKGNEYFFQGIALPKKSPILRELIAYNMLPLQDALYHEDAQPIKIYGSGGAMFIDSDVPHVIYQAEKDYDTNIVYAREVDDFFGYKEDPNGKLIKRFSLNSDS